MKIAEKLATYDIGESRLEALTAIKQKRRESAWVEWKCERRY